MPNSKATPGKKQVPVGEWKGGGRSSLGQLQLSANESLVTRSMGLPSWSRRAVAKNLFCRQVAAAFYCRCPVSLLLPLPVSLPPCCSKSLSDAFRLPCLAFIYFYAVCFLSQLLLPSFCLCVIVDNLLKFLCPALMQPCNALPVGSLMTLLHLIRKFH